jgi:hypothetical protein
MRAIDLLTSSVDMSLKEKTIELPNGKSFSFWMRPLTLGERSKAQKQASGDDANAFALTLLVNKAYDENSTRMFNAGDLMTLKNDIPAALAEKILVRILEDDSADEVDEADKRDIKSSPRKAAGI